MQFFLALFQFPFPYHIRTDDVVTISNVLESVIRNIEKNVYRVVFYVATCHVNDIWDNILFREFLRYVFPFEVNQILELYSVSIATDMNLNNEYEIRSMGIS